MLLSRPTVGLGNRGARFDQGTHEPHVELVYTVKCCRGRGGGGVAQSEGLPSYNFKDQQYVIMFFFCYGIHIILLKRIKDWAINLWPCKSHKPDVFKCLYNRTALKSSVFGSHKHYQLFHCYWFGRNRGYSCWSCYKFH